jgi:hypothetical protein
MKKFFSLIAVILPLSNLIAQTNLTQEFGKSISEVREFLKTKHFASITETEENKIVAATSTYYVAYYFDLGGLYKMETVSDFDNKKEAAQEMEAFKVHFMRLTKEVLDLNSDKDNVRFVALQDRSLHEVSEFSLGKNGAQIRLVSLDLDRAPSVAVDELRQDNLLFAMLHN